MYTLCMDWGFRHHTLTIGNGTTSQFDKLSECCGFSTNVPKIVQGRIGILSA